MVCAVLVRRLREGVTFEEFRRAWEPEQGFGVPTAVWHARRLDESIDRVIEGTVFRGLYEVIAEADLT